MKEGKKFDKYKPLLALIPPLAEEQIGLAFTEGHHKYGMHNWREGISVIRLLSAAKRHINKTLRGEDEDSETRFVKVHHLGEAMASCAMAYEMIKLRPDLDDRYKKEAKDQKKVDNLPTFEVD